MNQPKTLILITILILAVATILILLVNRSIAPSSTSQPLPSPVLKIEQMKISDTNISDQPIEITDVVKIKFDRPVNNKNLAISISPEEAIILWFDPTFTKLTIRPSNLWKFNTNYTVNVLKTTHSQNNESLDKDYQFLFSTKPYSGI